MATRNWLLGLTVVLLGTVTALADIGPPRPRVQPDNFSYKLYSGKDLSSYTIYACRTDKDPEAITITAEDPVTILGGPYVSIWLAAVPKDKIEKLGEEKIMKSIVMKKALDGVYYSNTLQGSRPPLRPPGGGTVNVNYDVTIDKKVYLRTISDNEARKLGKGSGSGSGNTSKQVVIWGTPGDFDQSDPPFWIWQRIQYVLAGILLSAAAIFAGVRLARRRHGVTPAPAAG
jgi:hypothetical protein